MNKLFKLYIALCVFALAYTVYEVWRNDPLSIATKILISLVFFSTGLRWIVEDFLDS